MTDKDELLMIGQFDQEIDVDDGWLLEKIDNIIQEALARKDVYIALNSCKTLKSIIKTSGIGLSKLLYLIYHYWDEFGVEDEFEDIVFEYVGLHRHTVERYVRVWGMYAEHKVPKQFMAEIQKKNIKDQIPIANALVQGYTISQENWEALAEAPDYNTVAQIIMEDVKQQESRKSSLKIYVDERGTIWVKKGEAPRKFVGSLEIHSDEEIVKMAIQRIIKNTGMLERL
jgi:hypothetical protein